MKIVVLTNNGSLFGKKILNDLISHEVKTEAVVVIRQPLKYHWRLFRFVQKRVGIIDALYFSVERALAGAREKEPTSWNNRYFLENYREMGMPVLYTRGTNSEETWEVLNNLSPDLVLLGQTGIVGKRLLDIPQIGTLNAHAGILPDYRGIDCAKWAIYNNEFDKVGASVHWVDSGVDTGNVIIKQPYRFLGHETMETLHRDLYDLCVSLLTRVVLSISRGDIPLGETQNGDEGNQYHKMPRKLASTTNDKLREFLVRIQPIAQIGNSRSQTGC